MTLKRNIIFGLPILLIIIVTINTDIFGQNDERKKILEELESEDFLTRQAAQNKLTEYIDGIQEGPRRESEIEYLLSKVNEKSRHRLNVGISSSIGQIRTFFWKVKDQKKAEKNLYDFFKRTDEPYLKKCLDSALMKADGLYWDAIWNYNYVKPRTMSTIDKTVKMFRRVFNEFPESNYASRAHYYLAKYYTRVYLIRKSKGWGADKNEWIAKESNATYQNYFKKVNDGKYKLKELMDAHYYLALNWILLGKLDNAINELEKIKESELKDEYPIYVYEYYYSKPNGNVINRYFPSGQLAEYTIKYLKNHPNYNDSYQKDFVNHMKEFEPIL